MRYLGVRGHSALNVHKTGDPLDGFLEFYPKSICASKHNQKISSALTGHYMKRQLHVRYQPVT